MVWEALYACGAADALMNSKLPAAIRNEYQLAYCIHYARGIKLINEAIAQHNEDLRTGREPDVLPLYHAVWLLHSSGVSNSDSLRCICSWKIITDKCG